MMRQIRLDSGRSSDGDGWLATAADGKLDATTGPPESRPSRLFRSMPFSAARRLALGDERTRPRGPDTPDFFSRPSADSCCAPASTCSALLETSRKACAEVLGG